MALVWPDFLTEVDGERRFVGSRLTPWEMLHFYKNLGYSPEILALEFPSVSLPVIHKFIAFYLENTAEMDALAAAKQAEIDQMRAASPNHMTLEDLRKRLNRKHPMSA
jgi:uncharacterized protein (DUF433 family)